MELFCDDTAAFKKKPCDFLVKGFFEDKTGPHKLAQWSGTGKCFISIAIGVMMEQLMQNYVLETPVKFNKVARDMKYF